MGTYIGKCGAGICRYELKNRMVHSNVGKNEGAGIGADEFGGDHLFPGNKKAAHAGRLFCGGTDQFPRDGVRPLCAVWCGGGGSFSVS